MPTARALLAQQSRYARIRAFCNSTLKTVFQPGTPHSVAELDDEKATQGEHFGRYREAVRVLDSALEALRAETTHSSQDVDAVKSACAGLIAQAQSYLDRSSRTLNLSGVSQLGRQKVRMVREGLAAAQRLSLAMQVLDIGEPTPEKSWNRATAAQVAGLRAAIAFATSGMKAKDFRPPDGAPAHWVDSKADGSGRVYHEFIFKPLQGDRSGRGPIKEVLASAMAGHFERITGIHLGVPDTQLVTLDPQAITLRNPSADGQPCLGSLQEFVVSTGTLKAQGQQAFEQVPARACQRLGICDVMFANLERHQENLLFPVAPHGAEFSLALIDHGEAFGGMKIFQSNSVRNGALFYDRESARMYVDNPLLQMPAAYLPFDDDMRAALAAFDPVALVQHMHEELQAMDTDHPDLDASGRVDAQRVHIAKRCLQFLRLASAELSPAAVRIALGRWGAPLLDCKDTEFDAIAALAIADIQPKAEAYKTLLTGDPAWQNKVFASLFQAGLWRPGQGLDHWIMEDPVRALATFHERELAAAGGTASRTRVTAG